MSDTSIPAAPRIPTIYFIDDSATMREVIKIAFRKESINVIACHDAASALAQFSLNRPDVVISDVIMPDKDGYEVCQYVKEHAELSSTPVILMSGVVNRQVAEKAMAAKADELMRKPFQPQELIARVKGLLFPKPAGTDAQTLSSDAAGTASRALSGLFAPVAPAVAAPLNSQVAPRPAMPTMPRPGAASPTAPPAAVRPPAPRAMPSVELLKLRAEVRRLEMLVKKLQSEIEAERQYTAELESQLRVHQES